MRHDRELEMATTRSMHLRRIFGLIASGYLVVGINELFKTKGFDWQLYVTEIAVVLTGILISVLFWTFKPDLEKFGITVTERDKKTDIQIEERQQEEARKHREKINDDFLIRRSQIFANVFTWFETFQSFADAKQYLQHVCTGHPELYVKMVELMSVEQQLKKIPRPIPQDMKEKASELKKQEEQLRQQVRQEFDDLQTKLRQKTEDVGGICENCIKFHNKRSKTFRDMKSRLDSFTMPF